MKFKFYKNPVIDGDQEFSKLSAGMTYHQTSRNWAVYEIPPGFPVQICLGPQRSESLRLKMGVIVCGQTYNQKTDIHGLMDYFWKSQLDLDILEAIVPIANFAKEKVNVYAQYTPVSYHGYLHGFRIHDIRVGDKFLNMETLVQKIPAHMRIGAEVFPSMYTATEFLKGQSKYRNFPEASAYGDTLQSKIPVAKIRMRPWDVEYVLTSGERCVYERLPLFGVTDIRKVIRYWRQLWSPEVINEILCENLLNLKWDKDELGNEIPWTEGRHPRHSMLSALASRIFMINVRKAKQAFIDKWGETAYANMKKVDQRLHNFYPMHLICKFLLQDYPADLTKNYPISIYPADDEVAGFVGMLYPSKSLPAGVH